MSELYFEDGSKAIPLKIPCPKAEYFGGKCPKTMIEWKSPCGHYYFIDEKGFCKCFLKGCNKCSIFIGEMKFHCGSTYH
jgi:hypothetical protein